MAFYTGNENPADRDGRQSPTDEPCGNEARQERRVATCDRRVATLDRRRVSGLPPAGTAERRLATAERRIAARDRRLPPPVRRNGNGHANGNGKVALNGNGHANGNGHIELDVHGVNGSGRVRGRISLDGANGNGKDRRPATRPEAERAAFGSGHLASGLSPADVSVSVVIPTLNEARNLPHVLPRIPAWIDEVVLVDGRSVDGTVELAKGLLPEIRIVEEQRPGKGAALQAGFRAARGDIIVTLDADGSADPAEIPAFVGLLLAGADFAKGSRFIQGGGTRDMKLLRKAGNWGLRALVRAGFGGRYSDLCYGYNAFWKARVLPVIEGSADGFEIETLMNVRVLEAGMTVAEVPSYEGPRIHGKSNLRTWRDGFRVLRTILREWTRPRRRKARTGAAGCR